MHPAKKVALGVKRNQMTKRAAFNFYQEKKAQ